MAPSICLQPTHPVHTAARICCWKERLSTYDTSPGLHMQGRSIRLAELPLTPRAGSEHSACTTDQNYARAAAAQRRHAHTVLRAP